MTARRIRSTIGLVALLVAAAMVATTLPALAAPPSGTAQITTARTVLAGELGHRFNVQACNPTAGTDSQPVSYVSVFPPPDMFVAGSLTTQPPTGWNASILAGGARVLYYGGTLLPGTCATFGLTATVARPATDQTRTWGVSASADGVTSSSYGPSSEGALTVTFPVLKVTQVAIAAPARATDNTVTAGQTARVSLKVINRASTDVVGSAAITGANTSSVCPDPRSLAPTPDVSAGDTLHEIVCDTTFASGAGGTTTTLTADVTATGVNAIDAVTPSIAIQRAVDLQFVANTLTPRAVNPDGTTPYEFKTTFKNVGAVSAENLVAAGTEIVFTNGATVFRARLKSPDVVPPTPSSGSGSGGTQLVFEPITIDGGVVPDGAYDVAVDFGGIDTNDVVLDVTKALTNTLLVDRLAPIVNDLRLLLPASLVKGELDAAGSGRSLGFDGQVLKAGLPCGDCTITAASVKQYRAGQPNGEITLDSKQIKIDDSGKITGSITPTLAAGTDQVELNVTVKHLAPQTTLAVSPRALADTASPRSDSAATLGIAGETNRTIVVSLSERVAWPGGPNAAQWSVQDNVVSDVKLGDSKGIGANDDGTPVGDTITLTVQRPLREDETPGVQHRAPPVSERPFDRVDLKLAENLVTAVDGILPAVPLIDTVNGRASQQDHPTDTTKKAFFTNQEQVRVRITQVAVGHRVELYRDRVGGDLLARGDVQQPMVPGSQPSITLTVTLPRTDDRFAVVARALDTTLNPSGARTEILVLDFTAPDLAAVTKGTGSDVVVTLSEPILEGRDSALDWTVTGGPDGSEQNAFNVGQVTGAWNTRTLTLDDFRYTRDGTVLNSVYYDFFEAGGPAGGRYVDRAGNVFGDTVLAAA
ncbi:MAG: hypothetical protein KY469_09330 [Actinobacteria bacterium]|nr:hypothetical protein [Actinomycetota bacterium]